MERQGYDLPLLIGGATTSKVHTAVKIDPHYHKGQTVYVTDASRAVGVVSQILSEERREAYLSDVANDYEDIAARHARGREKSKRLPLAQARDNQVPIDWSGYEPPKPSFLGVRNFETFDLASLVPYIDWSPFFQTWELTGKYPKILNDEKVGEAARQLYDDAQTMLKCIVEEKWFEARAVIGMWPANTIGDDIALYEDEERSSEIARLHTLRQQMIRNRTRANQALADYVAPEDSGLADYVGGFVVTTGHGVEARAKAFKEVHDDYSAIMVQALADRLAEAFAEAPGGFYDDDLAKKLVDHLFAVGNGMDPADAYRAFRGRDAKIEALMRDRGFPIPKN